MINLLDRLKDTTQTALFKSLKKEILRMMNNEQRLANDEVFISIC